MFTVNTIYKINVCPDLLSEPINSGLFLTALQTGDRYYLVLILYVPFLRTVLLATNLFSLNQHAMQKIPLYKLILKYANIKSINSSENKIYN